MYWGDNEEDKKKRLEEKLRRKKAKKKGEPLPLQPSSDDLEVIKEDDTTQDLLEQHQIEIRDLKHLLLQQNKMLQKIIEKQDTQYEVVYKPSVVDSKNEKTFIMPTLGEVDVKVIKTDDIESQGEIGESRKEGESVKGRAAKLKALKLKKGSKK